MPRSLVTGGAGFIGSHVADELMARGHEVRIFDNADGLDKDDITDPAAVDRMVFDFQPDYIFHLAAYAAEGLSHHIKRHNYMVNVIGSVNLINAAVNIGTVKCFVFTSSAAVYGGGYSRYYEDSLPRPLDSYGIAKWAVEQELKTTFRHFGLPYIIFRPHNVYGERQNIGDRYRNVVGIFMNQALKREPFTIFGDGSQERCFTYVADVAEPIARSVDIPDAYTQTFNVGSDLSTPIGELAHHVDGAMGGGNKIRYLPARHEAHAVVLDHTKFRQVFKYPAPTPLGPGLVRMAEWAKKVGPQEPSTFNGIEIAKNLPPSWA